MKKINILSRKGGTAYVGDDGKHTVIINSGYLNGKTKGEILGVISEEASHVINGAEGRQIATGTDEKGLESTGRATNEYFQDKYKDDDTTISLTSEGSIDTSKLGTNVGDKIVLREVPDKNGKRKSDELIENAFYSYLNYLTEDPNFKKMSDKEKEIIKENFKEAEKLFKNGEILNYKELKQEGKEKFFEILKKDNADELKIEKHEDGSETVEIVTEVDLDKINDILVKSKTEMVRAIIKNDIPIYYQTPTGEKIIMIYGINFFQP